MDFYSQLHKIRNEELIHQRNKIYNAWVNHYDEHLQELYSIFIKYQQITYDNFCSLAYDCTLSHYDYATQSYKKFLL